MRAARRGQALPSRARRRPRGAAFRRIARRRTYARYPRYPQVDSAFTRPDFMTATGCGRDSLPETGDRLPSHSPSGNRAGRLRAARRMEAEGRAADEAAARRKLRACPLANAKAAGFVKRPPGTESLRAGGTGQAGHRTSVQDLSDGKRDFGQRAVTGGEGASAFCPSGRTGFRPGSCEAAGTQDFGPWTCQAEPRLRPRIPLNAEPKASARGTADAGRGTSVPNLPSGEPPGLRP